MLTADLALKCAGILILAWIAALGIRRRTAAVKQLLWTSAFAALLALPFLSAALPAFRTPVLNSFAPASFTFDTTATAPSGLPSAAAVHTPLHPSPAPLKSANWPLWIAIVWAAGAVLCLAPLVAGCLHMSRLRRSSRPLHLQDTGELRAALGIPRNVPILESAPGSMPVTFGFFRPAIFMPSESAGWSTDKQRTVLLHELAHVRRGDAATHLLARTALSLNWWNPLAWAAWRDFLNQCECAADDMVLSAGARASTYAGHLLEVARGMQAPALAGSAAVPMARRSQLEGRLAAILDGRVRGNTRPMPWSVVALAAIAVVAPLAMLHAQDPARQTDPEALDRAGKSAAAQRNFDAARALFDRALAERARASGTQGQEYGRILLDIGDLELRRGKTAEAQKAYAAASAAMGNGPLTAQTLLRLGTVELARKDPDHAVAYFQQAQVADPARAGVALMWMGVARQQNDPADARHWYEQALAAQDPNSADAATTLEVFGRFLSRSGNADESQSMLTRASSIRSTLGKQNAVPPSPGIHRMGRGITPPHLETKLEPEYTPEARLALLQGTVVLYVEVGTDGQAHNIAVTRGLGLGLEERAIEAISQWRFKPGEKDGQPVVVAANIEVNFRLF